jgi:hypothetical protein
MALLAPLPHLVARSTPLTHFLTPSPTRSFDHSPTRSLAPALPATHRSLTRLVPQVAVVDTNNPEELPSDLKSNMITSVVDHHKLCGLKTEGPIEVDIRPLCSVGSVIYERLTTAGITPPKQIAGLILSCILSDSLEFRSPTTTEADKKYAATLAGIAGVNVSELANAMFEAKADISHLSPIEIVNMDSKVRGCAVVVLVAVLRRIKDEHEQSPTDGQTSVDVWLRASGAARRRGAHSHCTGHTHTDTHAHTPLGMLSRQVFPIGSKKLRVSVVETTAPDRVRPLALCDRRTMLAVRGAKPGSWVTPTHSPVDSTIMRGTAASILHSSSAMCRCRAVIGIDAIAVCACVQALSQEKAIIAACAEAVKKEGLDDCLMHVGRIPARQLPLLCLLASCLPP